MKIPSLLAGIFLFGLSTAPYRTYAAADNKLGMALLSARVESAGTLLGGSGATSAQPIAVGTYEVVFDRDIFSNRCTITGSLVDEGQGAGLAGSIALGYRGGNANGVFVQTRNPAGNLMNSDFTLLVFCHQ